MKPVKIDTSKIKLSYDKNLKIQSELIKKQADLKSELKDIENGYKNVIAGYINALDIAHDKISDINDKLILLEKTSLAFKKNEFSCLNEIILKNEKLSSIIDYRLLIQVIQQISKIQNDLLKIQDYEMNNVLMKDISEISKSFLQLESIVTSLVVSPRIRHELSCNLIPSLFETNLKLIDFFKKNLTQSLKILEWPLKKGDVPFNTKNEYANFSFFFINLFKLTQFYLKTIDTVDSSTQKLYCDKFDRYIYVHALVKPFEIRYNYHFHGSKLTNSLEKPEWGFNQILTWIKDHSKIIENNILCLIDENYRSDFYFEFISSLTNIVTTGILYRLEEYMRDELIFIHLIDQIFKFTEKIEELTGLSDNVLPFAPLRILDSVENDHIFNNWIKIQHNTIIKNITEYLEIESNFLPRFRSSENVDVDNFPELSYISYSFITLLINKAKITKNSQLQLKIIKFVLNLIHVIFDLFLKKCQNDVTINSNNFNKYLIFCNAAMFYKIRLDVLKMEPFFILLNDKNDDALSKIYDNIFNLMKNQINLKVDKIIDVFIDRLTVLSAGLTSASSSYGMEIVRLNIEIVFKEINEICKNRINNSVCIELNKIFQYKFNHKIDSFLLHSIINICEITPQFNAEILDLYNTYIAKAFHLIEFQDDICPLVVQKLL